MLLRLPKDWIDALGQYAEQNGYVRLPFVRSLISEGMARRKIEHSVDDYGVFIKKWRQTKAEQKRAKAAEYMRRYRAKLKRKKLAKLPKPDGILWTFHPSGQITTSDLDVLATSVGLVDSSGHFLPESTRYSKDRVLSELRKLAEQGPLPDPRYDEFLRLNPL